MIATAPTQALTSASIDWGPYYTYAVKSVIDGTKIDTDWCKGYDDGADKITELNDKAIAKGTKEKVKEVEDAIKDGSLHVFDTSTFTVDGKELDSWKMTTETSTSKMVTSTSQSYTLHLHLLSTLMVLRA